MRNIAENFRKILLLGGRDRDGLKKWISAAFLGIGFNPKL